MMLLQLIAVGALSTPVQLPRGPIAEPVGFHAPIAVVADTDTVVLKRRPRPHAIEYSDAYYTRLRIHQIASYTELPLFAAEWIVGQKLLNEQRTGTEAEGLKGVHTTIALGLGALFTINTVTGAWNLWDSRSDPSGRTLRWVHSIAMLGADAGFMWAAAAAGDDDGPNVNASHHRSIAIGSIALATAGTVMMWLFHD